MNAAASNMNMGRNANQEDPYGQVEHYQAGQMGENVVDAAETSNTG